MTACPFGLVGQQQLKAPSGATSLPAPRRSLPSCRQQPCADRTQPARASPSISTMQARQLPSGAIPGGGMPTQVRDAGAMALGDLPNGLARGGFDWLAVELERDLCCPAHGRHALRVRAGSTDRRHPNGIWAPTEAAQPTLVAIVIVRIIRGAHSSARSQEMHTLEGISIDDVVTDACLAGVGHAVCQLGETLLALRGDDF